MNKKSFWNSVVLLAVLWFVAGTLQAQDIRPYAGKVLYNQSTNPSNTYEYANIHYDLITNTDTIYGEGVSSTSSLIIADDFTVSTGETWDITSLFVSGYTQSNNSFAGLHIEILENSGGKPGDTIRTFPFVTEYMYSEGDIVAYLPEKVTLTEGTYWIAFTVVSGKENEDSYNWRWALEPDSPVLGDYSSYYYAYSQNNNATSSWLIKDGSVLDGTTGRGPNMSFSIHGQYTHDIGITKIVTPKTGEDLGNEKVSAIIRNHGSSNESDFRVQYKINDQALVEEICTETIVPGESFTYEFKTLADLSGVKEYNLWVGTELVDDEQIKNDSASTKVTNYGTVYNIADYNGQTITTCSGVFVDAGGATGDISANDDEFVVTFKADGPYRMVMLDFVEFTTTYNSTVKIYDAETADEGFILGTWKSTIGPSEPIIASNSSGALTVKYTGYPGTYIDQPGWIANVSCVIVADFDLSVSKIVAPVNGDNMNDPEAVTIAIKNRGKYAESDFDVQFSVVEAFQQPTPTVVTETVSKLVNPGDTIHYTFTQAIDVSEAREYEITAKTVFVDDWVPENDDLTGSFENYGKVYRINTIDGQTVTTCSGRFADEGGIDGGTVPGDYTTTLQSGSSTSRIALTFNRFRVNAEGDTLFIYDGTNINAPLIGHWSGAKGLGEIKSTTASGALTVKYVGTNSNIQVGWEADINCNEAYSNDMGIINLFTPISGEGLTTSEAISVMVKNHGYLSQSNITVSYNIYVGEDLVDSYSEPLGLTLGNGEQVEHTFAQTADLYTKNTYTISVKASIANDDNIDNDSSIYVIHSYGTTYRISDYHKSEIITCSGTFADEGGLGAPLLVDSAYITTIRPAEAGLRTRLYFNSFDVGYDGYLAIYDGEDMNAPLIGKWSYQQLSGEIKAKNSSGALTIDFQAPSVQGFSGWDADISCYEPVENDFAILDASVEKEPAMINQQNNIAIYLQNIGSLAQTKTLTVQINNKEPLIINTEEIAAGGLDTIHIPWMPERDTVYNIALILPVDDGEDLNDTLIFKTAAYVDGSLFESFEGEVFPPEFWYSVSDLWKKTDVTGQLSDTVQHGNFTAAITSDIEFGTDTLVTPLLNIKDGDAIRYLGMRTGGWLEIGWIDGETNEFHQIETLINYDQYSYTFREFFVDISEAQGVNRLAFVGLTGFFLDRVWGPKIYLPDVNMELTEIISEPTAILDSVNEVKVVMRNIGELNVEPDDYTVTIYQTGSPDFPLVSLPGIAIQQLQSDTISINVPYVFEGLVNIFARVDIDGDVDVENNISDTLLIDVYKSGTVTVDIGDGEIINRKIPMAMDAPYSVSQVIYTADQLGKIGYIDGISYTNDFLENQLGVETEIYLGITSESTVANGWADTATMKLVVNRAIDFKAGKNNCYISFDQPYLYNGGNLVVMVKKFAPEVYYDQSFIHTETDTTTAYYITSNDDLILNTLGLGIAKKLVPNTCFYIDSKGAALSGTVVSSYGSFISKAKVELMGSDNISVLTDDLGKFSFTNILANQLYNIKVTLAGYEPIELTDIYIDSINFSVGKLEMSVVEIPFAVITEPEDNRCIINWKHETEARFEAPFYINQTIESVYAASAGSDMWAGNKIVPTSNGTLVGAYIWAAAVDPNAENAKVTLEVLDKTFKPIAVSEPFYLPNEEEVQVSLPYISYDEEFYLMVHWENHEGTTNSLGVDMDGPIQLGYIGNPEMGFSNIEGTFTVHPAMLVDAGKKTSAKGFVGYDLYRGLSENMKTFEGWEKINNIPIIPSNNAVTYYDNNWPPNSAGMYMYAVRSLYDRDSSDYVFSTTAKYMVEANVTILANVEVGSPEGVLVQLENTDYLGIHNYQSEFGTDNALTFDNVEFGTYNITISSENYEAIELTDYVIASANDTIIVDLVEAIYIPFTVKAEVDNYNQTALVSWNGYNDTTQIILDDDSFESALIMGADDVASLGNLYKTNLKGQVVGANVIGLEYGDGGDYFVNVEIFNIDGKKLGTSKDFVIPVSGIVTVEFDEPVNFTGDFYAVVSWNAVGGSTNVVGMDYTGENAGKGLSYARSEGSGFVSLRDIDPELDGIFGIRPMVVVKGIDFGTKALKPKQIVSHKNISFNKFVPDEVISTGTDIDIKSTPKAFGSFNIYLNDMTAPYAENIYNLYYNFSNLDYGAYEVGVSSVYASGETEIVKATFNVLTSVENNLTQTVSVYPNPSTGLFYINSGMVDVVNVFSTSGTLVKTVTVNKLQPVIDLQEFNEGIYILNLLGTGINYTEKVIISE